SRSGQDDHREFLIRIAKLCEHRHAIHLRHFEIEDHGIGPFSPKEFQTLSTTIGEDYVIALPAEEHVEEISDTWLVVYHENLRHRLIPLIIMNPNEPRVSC